MALRIVIVGAAASGKSTLTRNIVATHPGISTFGVRRHFHFQIKQGTEIGRAAEPVVNAGGWIPDELVARAVRLEFERGGLGEEFIFEGMPGNRRQAELLDELLDDLNLPLTAAVYVNTPDEVCLARGTGRTVCDTCDGGAHQAIADPDRPDRCARCGDRITRRPGDTPELLRERLELHHQQTPAIVEYYRGRCLIELDGRRSPEELLTETLIRVKEMSGSGAR